MTLFATCDLQSGFKSGLSTSLCTATVKNVFTCYIGKGLPVLGCFFETTRTFDLVDHNTVFHYSFESKFATPVVRFLVSWYSNQKIRVYWDKSLSELSLCLMGFVRAMYSLLICILMVYWLSCRTQELVVTGVVLLLVHLAMLMILEP